MSRPLRIEARDAWYHVLNRGRNREAVFRSKNDHPKFIRLLQETAERWNLRVAAYCLMPNHYHLLVQTPEANLSRCMRHIDGVYTQWFNHVHDLDGALFRGRYKSILIDEDNYLLRLIRYIHGNPVKAGLVEEIDRYTWSSHTGYISSDARWDWIYKEYVLSKFSKDKREQIERYREFMAEDQSEDDLGKLEEGRMPSILGSRKFIDTVKERYYLVPKDAEIPQSRELAPSADQIESAVCDFYGVDPRDLMKSLRGVFNEPRNVAIYLMRRFRPDTLARIGSRFGISRYSSVSSVYDRMNRQVRENAGLRRKVNKLIAKINETKSQEQT
ncbi:transposase [bacterium]|nr:transposase [candidate division CSSED10-310 bacterium]